MGEFKKETLVVLVSPSGNKLVAVERKFYVCCFGGGLLVTFHAANML